MYRHLKNPFPLFLLSWVNSQNQQHGISNIFVYFFCWLACHYAYAKSALLPILKMEYKQELWHLNIYFFDIYSAAVFSKLHIQFCLFCISFIWSKIITTSVFTLHASENFVFQGKIRKILKNTQKNPNIFFTDIPTNFSGKLILYL